MTDDENLPPGVVRDDDSPSGYTLRKGNALPDGWGPDVPDLPFSDVDGVKTWRRDVAVRPADTPDLPPGIKPTKPGWWVLRGGHRWPAGWVRVDGRPVEVGAIAPWDVAVRPADTPEPLIYAGHDPTDDYDPVAEWGAIHPDYPVSADPPEPTCETCDGMGRVPVSGRGGDGFDPCPDCGPAVPAEPAQPERGMVQAPPLASPTGDILASTVPPAEPAQCMSLRFLRGEPVRCGQPEDADVHHPLGPPDAHPYDPLPAPPGDDVPIRPTCPDGGACWNACIDQCRMAAVPGVPAEPAQWTAHGGYVINGTDRRTIIPMPVGVDDGIEDCHERARLVAAALRGGSAAPDLPDADGLLDRVEKWKLRQARVTGTAGPGTWKLVLDLADAVRALRATTDRGDR